MSDVRKKRTKADPDSLMRGVRALMGYLAGYKWQIFVLSIASVVSATIFALIPYLSGKIIDGIIEPGVRDVLGYSLSLTMFFLVTWVVSSLVYFVILRVTEYFGNKLGVIMQADYAVAATQHLMALPIGFHKSNRLGAIREQMDMAAQALRKISMKVVINILPEFLTVVVGIIISFYISPLLASILTAGGVLYFAVVYATVRPLTRLERVRAKEQRLVAGDIQDSLINIQAVKQATAEEYENHRIYNRLRVLYVKASLAVHRTLQWLYFGESLVVLLTKVAIYVLAVTLTANGSITVGALVMFIVYSSVLFKPFRAFSEYWQQLQSGLIEIEQAEKILDTKPEVYEPEGSDATTEVKGDVSFKGVSFHYKPGLLVLEDVTFEVKAGETVALVGESGVGKSTLVDLISAYHFPTKGKVKIDGVVSDKISLSLLRQNIAVVSQEIVLFNDTIRNNLVYGRQEASDKDLRQAAKSAHALGFIERFPAKWEQVVGERGIKLSVGQKQRVSIARAILRNPRILILDEPTSALDAKTEVIIEESLRELMEGRTTFIIAHRLSTVRHADKILVFDKGKIVERGRHGDLLKVKNGVYKRLYELQIGLHE